MRENDKIDKLNRSQAYGDGEDDFFESLMEDIMSPSESVEPAQPAEDNSRQKGPDSTGSRTEEVVESKPSPPRRRGGLLNRVSGSAPESTPEPEDNGDDKPAEITVDVSPKDTVSTGVDNNQEDNAPNTSVRKRGLLGRRAPVSTPISDENSVPNKEEKGDEVASDYLANSSIGEIKKVAPPALRGRKRGVVDKVISADSGSNKDLMDDMLDDFDNEEDLEKLAKKSKLDPEVEVPLERPGMDQIAVTPDGRTLADMLPGLRSGNRPVNKIVSDIKNQDTVVEVKGKKFSDKRYSGHVEAIDKEVEDREKRIALSMKFLQRNANFTEQEKAIMKNLGLNSEQLSKLMKSTKLTSKQKKDIIGLGRYGSEKHFKGRRYRTTVGDSALLEFLVKFKYANTRILRWISNEPQNRTWRKLNRLRNSGLVESKSLIGVPDLWGATPSGTAIAGYSLAPGLRPMPRIVTISGGMGVNYLAACLWFNTVNVLNLEDFPANNRVISLQDDGRDRVRGEMLVSELEIRSSLGKEINPSSSTMKSLGDEKLYDVISHNVRQAFEEWEAGGKVGDSPESLLGNEYMWVLFPTSQLTLSYHVPDLVVKRERGPNGEPRSIAVEVERYEKSNDKYDKIMLAYKLDEHLYEKVIWVTPNTRVARSLVQAAEEVGFENYQIIPIITETGVYDKQDIWMI